MFSETLQKSQPIVYRTLKNALSREQLSHCYLFTGPKGTLKKETALFLAQSVVCQDSDPFACEQCASCTRILEGNYADLVYIDGEEKAIKNEQIQNLQLQFSKTTLETAGYKIFIINQCENMTTKAANSLLKFIEEPTSKMIGIFITSQPESLLPTIVSRCQNISFKPLPKDDFLKEAEKQNIDAMNSHIISLLVNNTDEVKEIDKDKSYNNAIRIFCEYMDQYFFNRNQAGLYLSNSFSKLNKSDKTVFKDSLNYFIDISLIFVNDYLNDYTISDETYSSLLSKAKTNKFDYENFLATIVEAKDACAAFANGLLIVDQLIYRLMEE